MPRQTNRPILPTLLGLLTITALFYYFSLTLASATKMPTSDAAAADPLSHLHVTLRQTSATPPTLTARVANTHPSTPFTLVTWDTPLDPLALKLGLATITLGDGDGGEELAIPTIQVRRKMPPDADAVVVIEAGGFREQEFVLAEPVVAVERIRGQGGGRARVGLRGRWTRVWEGRGQGEDGEEALGGEWQADAVEVEV